MTLLTRETFVGSWAGLPVAWTDDDEFDEKTYRADVARCCRAGVPGVYCGGTTGEFYAMEFEEFQAVARATVCEAHAHGVAAMVGVGSTFTRGAVRRAAFAAEIGADAVQLPLPYWMEIADDQIVPFFREAGAAAGDLAVSIYETTRSKKCLTVAQHRAIKEAVPRYLMVKANDGTVGVTAEGCEALSEFVNVFVDESQWAELGPHGAIGASSWAVYANPRVILGMWEMLRTKDWAALRLACGPLKEFLDFIVPELEPKGFTDSAWDRAAALATGFLKTSFRIRGPYVSVTDADVELHRRWFRDNFPEMLKL